MQSGKPLGQAFLWLSVMVGVGLEKKYKINEL